ncbi:medium-chain dehydrogenase/reductase like protein [Irpex lacteus]|nr:medium-chain dehydrogenase/reductase like protein [Irpex lacteus]
MSTHKALLLLEKQGDYAVKDIPTPKPGPGELLVAVHATGLNPVDWKIHDYAFFITEYPAILGTDAAGVVKEIGEGVTGFAVGDNLFQGYFSNPKATFQQYTIIAADITAKLPPNLGKVSTGELRGAELTAPWDEGGRGKYAGQPILIAGGASAVGQQAIQLAKLSGFSPIITTASLSNTDLLKSLGATHAITSEPIKYAYDAISIKSTQESAYEVLAPGGTLSLVLDFAVDEAKRDSSKRVARIFGSVHDPTQKTLGLGLYKNLTKLLESGDLKPNKVEVLPNGLAGIPDGLQKLKSGTVSATKLVGQPWA